MKFAFGVVPLDGVIALGRLVVAGLDLRSDWILAQRNSVRLDNGLAVAQVHLALRLFYENVVDRLGEHGFGDSFSGEQENKRNVSKSRSVFLLIFIRLF